MLKFQAVAEKTAKNFWGYFFAAPCRPTAVFPAMTAFVYVGLSFSIVSVESSRVDCDWWPSVRFIRAAVCYDYSSAIS